MFDPLCKQFKLSSVPSSTKILSSKNFKKSSFLNSKINNFEYEKN